MGIHRALRAVFIDRDGVITRAIVRDGRPFAPASDEDLELLPGVATALERLRSAGFHLVVVTNQPDVARGTLRPDVLERMHERLRSLLPLDDIRTCPHDDADGCVCRKPKPGLLEEAASAAGISLHDSFMVGDRWRDVEAGRRAGCTTIFVDYGYDEPRPVDPDVVVRSLAEAASWILTAHEQGGHEVN
jgi:D-glycero-D-manno-heptose 1,7-bisphosphate phosphatase